MIASVSTIPPRFAEIGPALESLCAQSRVPDAICLYIPRRYRRFPNWDGRLPEVPRGVEIRRCDEDWGPATKVLAPAAEFAGQDVEIVFGDDDRAYGRHLVRDFLAARADRPGCAIANLGLIAEEILPSEGRDRLAPRVVRTWRVTDLGFQLAYLWAQMRAGRRWRDAAAPWRHVFKRSGFCDIFEGCGGVMVRPEFFDEAAFVIPPVLWSVDDVWLSGCLARRGIGIWLRARQFPPADTAARTRAPLVEAVVDGADRQAANRMAAAYFQDTYGVWL